MGATNMNNALVKSINMIKNDIKCNKLFMNHIILITDGRPTVGVTNTKNILLNVSNNNKINKFEKISIFSFGIGENNSTSWINDLNYSFLRELSVANNGFDLRIKESNTTTNLNEYYQILSNPLLVNVFVDNILKSD